MSLTGTIRGTALTLTLGGLLAGLVEGSDYVGRIHGKNQVVSFFQGREQRDEERVEYLRKKRQSQIYCRSTGLDVPASQECYDLTHLNISGGGTGFTL